MKATAGTKETKLASQGFVSELRNAPFMGGPHACRTPATAMIRYSQIALNSCIGSYFAALVTTGQQSASEWRRKRGMARPVVSF